MIGWLKSKFSGTNRGLKVDCEGLRTPFMKLSEDGPYSHRALLILPQIWKGQDNVPFQLGAIFYVDLKAEHDPKDPFDIWQETIGVSPIGGQDEFIEAAQGYIALNHDQAEQLSWEKLLERYPKNKELQRLLRIPALEDLITSDPAPVVSVAAQANEL